MDPWLCTIRGPQKRDIQPYFKFEVLGSLIKLAKKGPQFGRSQVSHQKPGHLRKTFGNASWMFRVGVNHHSGWSHDDHNINRRSGDSSRPRKFGTMLNKHPGVIPVRVFWWWTVSSCVKRWPNHNISPTADCPEIAGDFPSSATFWGPRSYEDVWFDQNHVLVWFISKLPPTNLHVEKCFQDVVVTWQMVTPPWLENNNYLDVPLEVRING